jgi:hypothetical protein
MRLTRDDEDDNNDEDVAMDLVRAMASGDDRFIGGLVPRAMTGDKPTAIRKTAPGTSAKLRLGAAYNETLAVARAGTPTAMRLMMDDKDDDHDEDVAMDLVRATASSNDRFIGGLAPTGRKFSKSTSTIEYVESTSTQLDKSTGTPKSTSTQLVRSTGTLRATDRGPATVTDGAAPAGEYRSASVGLAAEDKRQY